MEPNSNHQNSRNNALKHNNPPCLRKPRGFTLIEIIVVLILLGILAAIAVPNFMNLVQDANDKAVESALAAGMSTCSLEFARLTLVNGTPAAGSDVATAATTNKPDNNDFNYTFDNATTTTVDVTVVWNALTGRSGTAFTVWSRPS